MDQHDLPRPKRAKRAKPAPAKRGHRAKPQTAYIGVAQPRRVTDNDPRRSPKPCDRNCPGWAVFGESAVHIERCDACWADVADAPDDTYYQTHPVCQDLLIREATGRNVPIDSDYDPPAAAQAVASALEAAHTPLTERAKHGDGGRS
jgi:hypothetical protein